MQGTDELLFNPSFAWTKLVDTYPIDLDSPFTDGHHDLFQRQRHMLYACILYIYIYICVCVL